MTDRLAKICGASLTAIGLAVAMAGCNHSEPQVDVAATATPEQHEPPRLLSEVAVNRPMDVPLTLQKSAADSGLGQQRRSLSVPPADRGAWGEETWVDPIGEPAATEHSSDLVQHNADSLQLPPADRDFVAEVTGEEAPLPELLPFETPIGLADHAGDAPSAADEYPSGISDPTSEQPTESVLAADLDDEPAPSSDETEAIEAAPHTADVAMDPESGSTLAADTPATAPATDAVESAEPLVSTGALAINNVKSIGAADRQIARFEVPTGTPASPADTAVAAQPAPVVPAPATVGAALPTEPVAEAVAVAESATTDSSKDTAIVAQPAPALPAVEAISPPSLAVSQPTVSAETAAVTPQVDWPKAHAEISDLAEQQPVIQPVPELAPTVRPSAPSIPATTATAAAPPASVEKAETALSRAPRPATAIAAQPPRIAAVAPPASNEPAATSADRATPAQATPLVRRGHDPSGMTALAARPPAPVQPSAAPPTSRRRAEQPAASEQLANQLPKQRAAPTIKPQPAVVAQAPARAATEQLGKGDRALPPAAGTPTQTRSAELIAISRLADEHTRRGFDLANRGAMYSARAEFIEAVQMVAHAVDAEYRSYEHSQALSDGLTAILESDDFVSQGGRLQDNIDVIRLAKPHHTPILKGMQPHSVSRLGAMQQYYTYAQRRLAFSVAHEPAGSLALYGLGKLYTVLAQTAPQGIVSPEPKAIVYHQAALMVDGRNYMAANDLGVLLARYGKYPQSKAALLHSLAVSPQPATWHNLTVVHQQLGEARLAELAQAESQAATARVKQIARAAGRSVTENATVVWLDPGTFAKSSELFTPNSPSQQGPQQAAPTTAHAPPAGPPAKSSWFRK